MEFRDRLRRHYTLLLFAVLVVGLLMRLGFWQLSRAQEKQSRASIYTTRIIAQPVSVDDLINADLPEAAWRRVTAVGRFAQSHVLLDNRTVQGRVGFEVLSPLQLLSGRMVLVNRGWVPAGPTRASIPALVTQVTTVEIHGHLGPPPVTGVKFSADAERVESLSDNIIRTQHVNLAALGEHFDTDLGPFVLYMDGHSPAGFLRSWTPPGDGSAKHRAYAVQWFAMAAVLATITFFLLIRPNNEQRS